MIDIRQTPQYARYLSKIGWRVERIKEINYFIKKISHLGVIIKIQRPEEIRIKDIEKLNKKYRIIQTIIEPKTNLDAKYLLSLGFKHSNSPYLPTKTLHLDLTQDKQIIIKNLKKDCRKQIEKHEKLETKIYSFKELSNFRNAWKKSTPLNRYIPPLSHLEALIKSFSKKALFITDKDLLSGAIFLKGDQITYYWQAFSSKKARQLQVQYRLVWEGVLWGKTDTKIFDFEGIYDKRFPNKKWLGFTHFKKSFNGEEIKYPGTFIKSWYNLKR